ncbi:ubiquitin carboxyl-terminal hydrolase 48-like isoform X2 [Periplaneta americana]|uniref:ubiquitin carboxyl-terminal hydrolase 48-like isoform X2 n=1 Tax=Periplaneta americana TaxID=6978 RepID=UPI0037E97917
MKTMRKEDMDKAAWCWVDNTEPKFVSEHHVELAYRIKMDVCGPNSCRRNCKGNPRCLSGLGESKWLGPKAAAAAEDAWGMDMVDPNEERREEGMFVGLKNLGATCYVNSLLQLWFHNLKFRHAVYSWSPEEDPQEMANLIQKRDEGQEYSPESSIGHLQLLFALLQFGKRRYVDPTSFILSLGLDTTTQQDAQEFSKLFISMLEERLSHQSSPLVKNIINDQFCGKYSYVTKCQQCGTESARPSMFYELELNIAGHKTLADCLEEFLKEERLEGADRYHCAVCMDKQDATRSITLERLPPVLNLQLMRFVFDRQKGCKKKLSSYLQFPENLDMSMYLQKPNGSLLYVLSAVLIHCGHSANSGHYVAHICDSTTSTWYKFNDEAVEKMEGKKLKLGADEDGDDGNKKVKLQRVPKGFLTSNSAYMLVYTKSSQPDQQNNSDRKSSETADKLRDEWVLPERLSNLVKTEDRKFEDWVQEMNETKAVTVESGKARQQEMSNLYNMLPATEGVPFEFILSDWLAKWLTSDDVKPIDNSKIVCPHGKLDPSSVPQTKCITSVAGDLLFAKYGGGPRLPGNSSMCLPCVKHRCKVIRLKNQTAEDMKKVISLLKAKLDSSEPTYWVGKNSLKCWRKLVLEEVEEVMKKDDEDANGCSPEQENGECSSSCNVDAPCDSAIGPNCSRDIQTDQNISTCSGNRVGSVSLNFEDCESSVPRTTRSRTQTISKQITVDCSQDLASKSSPLAVHSSGSNSPVTSCGNRSIAKNVSSPSKISSTECEAMETEVSSTVSVGCEDKDARLDCSDTCKDSAVTSSDEVLGSEREVNSCKEETGNKTHFAGSKNVSLNGISRTCSSVQLKPSYIRIRTPGFGDDIIQPITYDETLEESDQQGNGDKIENETRAVPDVSSSDDIHDNSLHNGRQTVPASDSQKLETSLLKDEDENEEEEEGFNEDILCVHGNLCVEESRRRLVSQQVWDILKVYFPSAKPFKQDDSPCSCCQNLATQGKAARDVYRQTAAVQKDSLMDLYYDRNRISIGTSASLQRQKQPINHVLHLVSREFIDSWRRFIRSQK